MKVQWFVKENTHLQRGAFGVDFGWGNGYAAIPKGHKCFGLGSGEIHDLFPVISVNGGLTFAAPASGLVEWADLPGSCKGHWIVGFDTCHYGDSLMLWPKLAVEDEAKKLAGQLESIV